MSTLKVSNIQATGETASRAVSGVAAVWVQHTDLAVNNASFGISSIFDDAVGINTLNFTNAFSGTNFITAGMAQTGADRATTVSSPTTTSTVIEVFDTSGSNVTSTCNQAIFGELA